MQRLHLKRSFKAVTAFHCVSWATFRNQPGTRDSHLRRMNLPVFSYATQENCRHYWYLKRGAEGDKFKVFISLLTFGIGSETAKRKAPHSKSVAVSRFSTSRSNACYKSMRVFILEIQCSICSRNSFSKLWSFHLKLTIYSFYIIQNAIVRGMPKS